MWGTEEIRAPLKTPAWGARLSETDKSFKKDYSYEVAKNQSNNTSFYHFKYDNLKSSPNKNESSNGGFSKYPKQPKWHEYTNLNSYMTSHLCSIISPFWGYILSQRWLFALGKSAIPNTADDVLCRRSLLPFVEGLQQITYALPLNNTSLTVTEI